MMATPFNAFTVLSVEDIKAIHDASIEVLREVGVHVPHDGMLQILADAGADVDFSKKVARMPGGMVTDALHGAGKKYVIHGRSREKKARFGYGDFVLVSTAGQYSWVDEEGGPRREPASADMKKGILVGDALEHIDVVGAMAMPLDVPVQFRDVYMAAELVKGTSKPAHLWVTDGTTLRYILEIYEAVSGGKEEHRRRPMMAAFVEPISPLQFATTGLEILLACASEGLPVGFGPMAQSGATAPVTLAGTLVVENAEILAGITMSQAVGPGCPVCYGGIPHIMDMRTTVTSFGSPEQGLMGVAMAQIAKHYGLPVYVNVGLGDSKRVDAQGGLERGMTLLMGALAGADTFGHMGICGPDQGASLEQLIVDDEMAAYVKRVLRGFAVNGETLALDVIRAVGIGGNFLAEDHTAAHLRRELWMPDDGFDRRAWEEWWEDGAKDMADRAREKKERILSHHRPEPLDAGLGREIDKIVESAKKELAGL